MSQVQPIPDGFHTITPYLMTKGCADAIEFYKKAFGAEEVTRMLMPDGKSVMHAEMQIGDSRLMLAEEFPDMGCKSPLAYGGTPVSIHLYVEDVDKAFQRAQDAGATVLMPPTDMFWGDRFAKVRDSFGHEWSLATHVADPTPEEMAKGAEEAFKNCGE